MADTEFRKGQLVRGWTFDGPSKRRTVEGKYRGPRRSWGKVDGKWATHEIAVGEGEIVFIFDAEAI